jgi:hypothetical protein
MAYLADVLERIVSGRTKQNELHTLLPWNWIASTSHDHRPRRMISSGLNRQLKSMPAAAVALTVKETIRNLEHNVGDLMGYIMKIAREADRRPTVPLPGFRRSCQLGSFGHGMVQTPAIASPASTSSNVAWSTSV